MADDDLDMPPGMHQQTGAIMAVLEQQRAGIIDAMRTARAASVTLANADGDVRHWAMCVGTDVEPPAFLLAAAVKAIADAAEIFGGSPLVVCNLALDVLADGDDG